MTSNGSTTMHPLSPDVPACPWCGHAPVAEEWYYAESGGFQVACTSGDCAIKPRTAVRATLAAAVQDWTRQNHPHQEGEHENGRTPQH